MIASHKKISQVQISEVTDQKTEKLMVNEEDVTAAWRRIAPVWPLSNIVATNPLQGYEDLAFSDALDIASGYYIDSESLPELKEVNRETIKWCQVLLDQRHATFRAISQNERLLNAFMKLFQYDDRLNLNNHRNRRLIHKLLIDPERAIDICLHELAIAPHHCKLFLILCLTTLPGWAGYVKYMAEWQHHDKRGGLLHDYLAMRVVIMTMLWPAAGGMIKYYLQQPGNQHVDQVENIHENENTIIKQLIDDISQVAEGHAYVMSDEVKAQFVFCIDTRSEPMRRAIEAAGQYETFGYAGFFGLPLQVSYSSTTGVINACPAFIKARHDQTYPKSKGGMLARFSRRVGAAFSHSYQSLKYSFNTPFLLVDFVGFFSGLSMMAKTFMPRLAHYYRHTSRKHMAIRDMDATELTSSIPFEDQCEYALQFLQTIGLLDRFAPEIVICGHESHSENNAYASSLDCGACGGSSGVLHAKILASIMNNAKVREHLSTEKKIDIPGTTIFYSAIHVTSTDEVVLTSHCHNKSLKRDIDNASNICRQDKNKPSENIENKYAYNWAQVRPEWGLVNNAAIIVGPRSLTQTLNLHSTAFLHSYNFWFDEDSAILKSILSGPVRVAYWINMAYLFSTLNNDLYGAGSKITHNITAKQNIMQGNASDIMMGLPMQSLFERYDHPTHKAVRLNVFIHAPLDKIKHAVLADDVISQLVLNEWIHMFSIEPDTNKVFSLTRYYEWIMCQ